MRTPGVRHRLVGPLTGLVVAALIMFVAAAPSAAAAPEPSRSANAKIAAIAKSTVFAASHLQHAPNRLRQLAADAILFESLHLLAPHQGGANNDNNNGQNNDANSGRSSGHAAVGSSVAMTTAAALTAAITVPGTVLGGLDLNGYCQGLGLDHSTVNGPIQAPGAAYTWYCVAASGAMTPISLQSACLAQYTGQVTIAYPQDINDAYTWVCIAPTAGTTTDPATNTTVVSLTTANGAVILIVSPTGASVTFTDNGSSGTVVQDPTGGYIAGNSGGSTLPVLTFEGGGSTLPVLAFEGSGGTLPI